MGVNRGKAARAEYAAYLRSPKWRLKRAPIMDRCSGICEYQEEDGWYNNGPILRRCKAPAVHIHHMTYDRIFDEAPEDLLAVCNFHHIVLHLQDEQCELCGNDIFNHTEDIVDFVGGCFGDLAEYPDLETIREMVPGYCDHCEHIISKDD